MCQKNDSSLSKPVDFESTSLNRLEADLHAAENPERRRDRQELIVERAGLTAVAEQVAALQTELKELATMSGKNRGLAQVMVARLENDRKTYEETVQAFRATAAAVGAQGATLLGQLGETRIEEVLNTDRAFIEGDYECRGGEMGIQFRIRPPSRYNGGVCRE